MKFFEILIDLSRSCGKCRRNGLKMIDSRRFSGLISGEKLPIFGINANNMCTCFVNKIQVLVLISFPVSSIMKIQTRLISSTIASLSTFWYWFYSIPLTSKKAGRFEKLLGFARSHSIVTRGSMSLSCATTPHPSCFSKS